MRTLCLAVVVLALASACVKDNTMQALQNDVAEVSRLVKLLESERVHAQAWVDPTKPFADEEGNLFLHVFFSDRGNSLYCTGRVATGMQCHLSPHPALVIGEK